MNDNAYNDYEQHEFVRDESLPADYEECGDCGYDHQYDAEEAGRWHRENPGSYAGLDIEENDNLDEGDEELDEAPKSKHVKPQFKVGQRVMLLPFDNGEEIVPEQRGVILGVDTRSKTCEIEIDEEYRTEDDFDGMTEVGFDQIVIDDRQPTSKKTIAKCSTCGGEIIHGVCFDCDFEDDDAVHETQQESFSFDKYVDAIVLKEGRCITKQPDSPMRLRQQRRQEHPTGRVRYTR